MAELYVCLQAATSFFHLLERRPFWSCCWWLWISTGIFHLKVKVSYLSLYQYKTYNLNFNVSFLLWVSVDVVISRLLPSRRKLCQFPLELENSSDSVQVKHVMINGHWRKREERNKTTAEKTSCWLETGTIYIFDTIWSQE